MIFAKTEFLLGAPPAKMSDTIYALREATSQCIANGQVFFLGSIHGEPVLGSVISGWGVVELASGLEFVHRDLGGCFERFGVWSV